MKRFWRSGTRETNQLDCAEDVRCAQSLVAAHPIDVGGRVIDRVDIAGERGEGGSGKPESRQREISGDDLDSSIEIVSPNAERAEFVAQSATRVGIRRPNQAAD